MLEMMPRRAETSAGEREAVPLVLPIPTILDASAAVLLHLVIQARPQRPLVLDAVALREICPVGALLLAAALAACTDGPPPRILNLSSPLRLELSRHPLLEHAAPARAEPSPPSPFSRSR